MADASATFTPSFADEPRRSDRVPVLSRIFDFLVDLADAHPLMREAARLQAMSDDELAERGLTRADIPRRVFGDRFYA